MSHPKDQMVELMFDLSFSEFRICRFCLLEPLLMTGADPPVLRSSGLPVFRSSDKCRKVPKSAKHPAMPQRVYGSWQAC